MREEVPKEEISRIAGTRVPIMSVTTGPLWKPTRIFHMTLFRRFWINKSLIGSRNSVNGKLGNAFGMLLFLILDEVRDRHVGVSYCLYFEYTELP